MRTNFHIFLLILSTTAVQPCFSSGTSETNTTVDGTVISDCGALGGLEAVPSGPLYIENGGGNIRLAVLAPQIQGEVPAYLPKIAASGNYSENDFVRIGNLTNAQYFLFGAIQNFLGGNNETVSIN